MAQRIADLIVLPVDGQTTTPVLVDSDTQIALTVNYQNSAVTATTVACTLRCNSATVTLSPVAASGEVTATVTAANLTSLSAGVLTVVTALWSGTYTTGGQTYRFNYEQQLIVTDRLFRSVVTYEDLAADLPEINETCALPSGQSTWWKQIRLAWEKLLAELELEGIYAAQITNPVQLRWVAHYKILMEISRVMYSQSNGQVRDAAANAERFQAEYEHWLDKTVVTLKQDNAAFTAQTVKANARARQVVAFGTGGM